MRCLVVSSETALDGRGMAKRTKPTAIRTLFGRRLRELRKARGLSLEAFGERAGVDGKYVQCLETAKQAATVDTIGKLAEGLGVEPSALFTFDEEGESDVRGQIARMVDRAGDRDARRIAKVLRALVG